MNFSGSQLDVDFSKFEPPTAISAIKTAKNCFSKNGCFVARGLFSKKELGPIQDYIKALIKIKLDEAQSPVKPEMDSSSRFDDGFIQLNKISRSYGGAIYDACRRLLPVHELSVHPKLTAISKALMGTDLIISYREKPVRVDHPNEEKFLFPWHQDYPYTQDSEDGLIYWIPLHDVTEQNGSLRVSVGSHQAGVIPIKIMDYTEDNKVSRSHSIKIADESLFSQYPQASLSMKEGDVLVFHTLLVHRSQSNQSNRARWTIQLRHGNFTHPKAIKKNWPGSMIDGFWFHKTHPEYVANLDEITQFESKLH